MDNNERISGILLHPTSLPSPYGIGDLGRSAYEFVDFLERAGQHLWQILPLTHTGYGDSPYQSFSAFAGQPLLLCFGPLVGLDCSLPFAAFSLCSAVISFSSCRTEGRERSYRFYLCRICNRTCWQGTGWFKKIRWI